MTTRAAHLHAFGGAVNQLRTAQGLSTQQLARRAGVAHQRLQAIENGQEDPGYQLIFHLAQGLDVAPVELVGLVEARIPTAP